MTGGFVCIECGGRFFDELFTRTGRGPECEGCATRDAGLRECAGIAIERVDPKTIAMYRDLRPVASGVHVNQRHAGWEDA